MGIGNLERERGGKGAQSCFCAAEAELGELSRRKARKKCVHQNPAQKVHERQRRQDLSFAAAFDTNPTYHDCEDQSHDIDWVRWAKTRDNGEPQIVLGCRHVLFGLVIFRVGFGAAAVQCSLGVCAGHILGHGRSRW